MKATKKIISEIANCSEHTAESVLLGRRTDLKNVKKIEAELNRGFRKVVQRVKKKYSSSTNEVGSGNS